MAHLARATVVVLAMVTLGAGCAQRPVLYPNATVEDVSKAEAAGDIAYCRARADEYVFSGATAGLLHGTIKSAGPSPIYKGFVDRCLSNMGYQVIGWQ